MARPVRSPGAVARFRGLSGREYRRRLTGALSPDDFAAVMATGMLSVGARGHHLRLLSLVLGIVAALAYLVLTCELVVRLVTGPGALWRQLADIDLSLRSFSFVAATCVLATRFDRPAAVVWVLGFIALTGWVVLATTAIRALRPVSRSRLRARVHGGWLLPSVATTGLAITATDLVPATARPGAMVGYAAVMWLSGIAVYIGVTSLIIGRIFAAPLHPKAITPDTWIMVGALAIGALAGDHLHTASDALGWSGWPSACVQPITVVLWSGATLSLALLVWAEVWRAEHRTEPAPLSQWWSGVFPLATYSVATQITGSAVHAPALAAVSFIVFSDVLTAWILIIVIALYRATRTPVT